MEPSNNHEAVASPSQIVGSGGRVVNDDGYNANHHLWENHGIWFINYTIHPDAITKERIRHSLKTRCIEVARYRRDLVLAAIAAKGILSLPSKWTRDADAAFSSPHSLQLCRRQSDMVQSS